MLVLLMCNGAWASVCISYISGPCYLTGLVLFVGMYNGVKMVASLLFTVEDFFRTGCQGPLVLEFKEDNDEHRLTVN